MFTNRNLGITYKEFTDNSWVSLPFSMKMEDEAWKAKFDKMDNAEKEAFFKELQKKAVDIAEEETRSINSQVNFGVGYEACIYFPHFRMEEKKGKGKEKKEGKKKCCIKICGDITIKIDKNHLDSKTTFFKWHQFTFDKIIEGITSYLEEQGLKVSEVNYDSSELQIILALLRKSINL